MRSSTSFVTGLAHLAFISKATAEYCNNTLVPSWTTVQIPGFTQSAVDAGSPGSIHSSTADGAGAPLQSTRRPNPSVNDQFPASTQRSPSTTTTNQATSTARPNGPGETTTDTDPVESPNFQYSAFFDFRNVVAADGPTPWSPSWSARTWFRPATDAAPLELSYLPSEIYMSKNTASGPQAQQDAIDAATYLTLRTQRLNASTQAAAGLDYIDSVTTVSMRMLARVGGSPGAVAALFTYYNDTTESDVEVLTRDGNGQVRVSNQPTADPATGVVIPDASFNVSVPAAGSTAEWNVYRLDLLGGRSVWYLNGELVASTVVNVPKGVESTVTLNMWSNGGGFTGEMDVGGEAVLEVQWVEMYYNSNRVADVGGGGGSVAGTFMF